MRWKVEGACRIALCDTATAVHQTCTHMHTRTSTNNLITLCPLKTHPHVRPQSWGADINYRIAAPLLRDAALSLKGAAAAASSAPGTAAPAGR